MRADAYLPRDLPAALQGLTTLALDLRWSWYHGTDRLWRNVDAALWEASGNPWLVLQTVSDQRLQALAADADFLHELRQQLAQRDAHFDADTWYSGVACQIPGSIAYFSMEFGLSESLPIYSGGLGVLAGDFLKTACDLGVPIVGIGLLYQQGYFRQAIDAGGEQIDFHPYNDPTMLPVAPLRDATGEWVHVALELPGRALRLRTWRVRVGRRQLLLLDSNDPRNNPGDRGITAELYGGGTELRLQQEIVLGIGGWRLLEQLGEPCSVCHVNEGHAAFALLERARAFMQRHQCDFSTALRATRAGNLFTSHTPVASGFDRFPAELMAHYFRDYAAQLGLPLDDLLALGRIDAHASGQPFIPACLAVRASNARNGVSRLHGAVSRRLLAPLFPRWPLADIPIGAITNGVHVPSWDSVAADTLWTDACGKSRWRGDLAAVGENVCQQSDVTLWQLRADNRRALVSFLDRRGGRRAPGAGIEVGREPCGTRFDADALTIGLARRFASYKRPNLLLHDPERLVRLLTNSSRPVQLVVAGKAHPQDRDGKRLLHEWQQFLQRPELRQCAVFIEDYDLVVASALLQGVDLWINTPRRPWEACGTSGMKILVNGGLNLSVLDGWWAEAYRPELGWALGCDAQGDQDAVDAAEALQLYRLLEEQVVPEFYRRDQNGLPREWIARMRASMTELAPRHSSNRMLREYTERYYLPLAREFGRRETGASAAALEQWCAHLLRHWARMHFGQVTCTTSAGQHDFDVQLYLEEVAPEWVSVELYADAIGDESPGRIPLTRVGPLVGSHNAFRYRGCAAGTRAAADYTVRVIPRHEHIDIPVELPLVLWQR